MKRVEAMPPNTARRASQIRQTAILTAIFGGRRVGCTSSNAIRALVGISEIASPRPPQNFIEVGLAVLLFPYNMRTTLRVPFNKIRISEI